MLLNAHTLAVKTGGRWTNSGQEGGICLVVRGEEQVYLSYTLLLTHCLSWLSQELSCLLTVCPDCHKSSPAYSRSVLTVTRALLLTHCLSRLSQELSCLLTVCPDCHKSSPAYSLSVLTVTRALLLTHCLSWLSQELSCLLTVCPDCHKSSPAYSLSVLTVWQVWRTAPSTMIGEWPQWQMDPSRPPPRRRLCAHWTWWFLLWTSGWVCQAAVSCVFREVVHWRHWTSN